MNFSGLLLYLLSISVSLLHVHALSIARSPIRHASLIQDLHFSQSPKSLDASSNFQVEFTISKEQQRIQLNLQPSRNVISRLTDVRHVGPDGASGLSNTLIGRDSPLLYKGDAFISDVEKQTWRKVGWARIMVRSRNGRYLLEGVFNLDGDYHHISPSSNLRNKQFKLDGKLPATDAPYMVVWKESDNVEHDGGIFQRSLSNASICGTQSLDRRSFSLDLDDRDQKRDTPRYGFVERVRRQNGIGQIDPVDVIGQTSGCPSTRRVAMIGVATDCSYTAEFDSLEDARENIISQINIASQVYEDAFNISLAIRNLTISDSSCPSTGSTTTAWNLPCSSNADISRRLSLFSEWRSQFSDENAAWSLMSACESGSTVGMAWIGNICSRGGRSWRGGSSVASANVVIRTAAEWQVFAHELAHNFGASHDCTSETCSGDSPVEGCCPLSRSTCDASGQYIMNPRSGRELREFSPCTIGTICTAIGDDLIDTSCLVDEDDAPDINESQCGNGIVEPGEACDCGGEEGCPENSCCNPSTCQLQSGAACDPATDACCTDQCQIASSGQVCRESTGSCDPEETCDGESSRCPEDERDDSCGDDNGGGGSGGRGGGSGGGSGRSWFDENRTVVIAVAASVGGVIVALILGCFIASCVRKRRRRVGNRLQKNSPFDANNTPPVAMGEAPAMPRMVHRYM
ncbi:hypothetical protein NW754_005243 [Fusarium falciforme]|uniref:Disintegrin and metalloproteinase domain-containing protein B n=1 Tax=Fusarium falciforme TaxID=195108 RepID=A0A9W8REI0_9HYPO|nr:hypothetical protein NW754_005243 [Fusarium falciforme]KAJ4195021.1 hypothetical protein NW755_002444 [Fusarium falciforme]KAJ4207442.1 hypothetical protein NW767_002692 [Fusarium falciforme]KAJ4244939.1 hypothetical protein NW757_010323 [Fusarium falciforme]